jgi:hypothetical protein
MSYERHFYLGYITNIITRNTVEWYARRKSYQTTTTTKEFLVCQIGRTDFDYRCIQKNKFMAFKNKTKRMNKPGTVARAKRVKAPPKQKPVTPIF